MTEQGFRLWNNLSMRYTPPVKTYLESLPKWYSGKLNFVWMATFCAVTIALAASQLDSPSFYEWLLLPVFFVFANGVEWFIHSTLLHNEFPFAKELYRRHTILHHAAYTHNDMSFNKDIEIGLVLFPVWAFPTILLLISPVPLTLWWLGYPNAALLFLITGTSYYFLYECFHFMHHMSQDSPIAQIPFIQKVRQLHLRHHDPRVMSQKNFNIFLPLFDRILGTIDRN